MSQEQCNCKCCQVLVPEIERLAAYNNELRIRNADHITCYEREIDRAEEAEAVSDECVAMLKRLEEEMDHGHLSECLCSRGNKCMACILLDDTAALLSRIGGKDV